MSGTDGKRPIRTTRLDEDRVLEGRLREYRYSLSPRVVDTVESDVTITSSDSREV